MSKVYLVGGGPGSLDLYTKKAMECIANCDCIIYDSLINDEILDLCKKDCEKIFAGKRAGRHSLKQEEINDLIVECARKYENVVRLKGGDVYVFGRGGEEGIRLYDEGIDFEVVPGISSSIAGLAYAGIPITHRGISHGFQVITATTKQLDEEFNHYVSLLDDDMTYVFLMGRNKLEVIVDRFINAGKNPATPVALISNATLDNQLVVTGTLETIIDEFKNNPIPAPLLIVVGKVVELRNKLDFFKPISKKSALITKVGHDDHVLYNLLKNQYHCVEATTGSIEFTNEPLPSLEGVDGIVFTSKNGVHAFMNQFIKEYADLRKLHNVKLISIGPKTNEALKSYYLQSDFVSPNSISDCLNEYLSKSDLNKLLIVRLKDYQSIQLRNDADLYYDAYMNVEVEQDITGHFDVALFTCASSVERISKYDVTFDLAISIGKKTTEMIQKCYPGIAIKETNKPDKKLMVQLLED